MYFENYDLKSVVTPVDVDRLEFLLKNTGYNPEKTHTLGMVSNLDLISGTGETLRCK